MNTNHNDAISTRREIVDEAKLQAKRAGETVAQKAGESLHRLRSETRKQADHQKKEVVHQMKDLRTALDRTADELDNDAIGGQLHRVAETIDSTAASLEQAELEEIVEAAEDFGRSQPTVFLASCFTLGLLTARFLRASTPAPSAPSTEVTQLPTQREVIRHEPDRIAR